MLLKVTNMSLCVVMSLGLQATTVTEINVKSSLYQFSKQDKPLPRKKGCHQSQQSLQDLTSMSPRQIAGTRRRANPLKRSTFQLANFINSAVASIFKTQGIQIHRQNCRRGLSRPHYSIICKIGFCRIILQLLFTFALAFAVLIFDFEVLSD